MLWQPGTFGGVAQPRDHWRRPQGGVVPAYTFRSINQSATANAFITASIDIGTASADRLVIVGGACGNAHPLASVVVGATSLNVDVERHSGNFGVGIASGLVTSGSGSQTIVATFTSGAFNQMFMAVWTATGLGSNVKKNTQSASRAGGAGGSANIAVDAADFLFVMSAGAAGAPTFSGSTQSPTGTNTILTGPVGASEDWIIVSTNASFSVAMAGTNDCDWAGASYI